MNRPLAGVVDYGMGNLASVAKALEQAGCDVAVSNVPEGLERSDLLVIPGVGNFEAGMRRLQAGGLDRFIIDWAASGGALLGICLGMQLLFDESEEGGSAGLGVLTGRVVRIRGDVKVPHIGWNEIVSTGSSLFDEFSGRHFYFVHSYACVPEVAAECATTDYGGDLVASVVAGNIIGVQFHPEKSATDGLRLLDRVRDRLT